METIKIVIADYHDVVRLGLANFLALDNDLEVIGMATNGDEALQVVRDMRPQVLLLDLRMPGITGFEVLNELQTEPKPPKTLVLTGTMDRASIQKALRLGASGFLLKDIDGQALCKAIRTVVTEDAKLQLMPQVRNILRGKKSLPLTDPGSGQLMEALTRREKEVLALVARGLSNKQIGDLLAINEKTIKTYVSNLLCKLNAQSRTQATLKALQLGLLSK
jgi:two-component system, NarL family, response regulator LiaR